MRLTLMLSLYLVSPSIQGGESSTFLYQQAALRILSQPNVKDRGYCLVYGGGQGQLAHALAQQSEMKIVSVCDDPNQTRAGRELWGDSPEYGRQITLHTASLDDLPYRDYSSALVVCDSVIATGRLPGRAEEMFRMVRPHGGLLIVGQPAGCPYPTTRQALLNWLAPLGLDATIEEGPDGLWATIERDPLPGAGQWTHLWADPGNTACSFDRRISTEAKVLWFGEPGPRIMVDRHWRPMSPLYRKGRLIVPGNNHIVCLDAYNGARYWDLDLPRSARVAILRDSGWLALGEDALYAAVDNQCHCIELEQGRIVTTWTLPEEDRDWGYLAYDEQFLYGSLQRQGASRLAVDYYDKGSAGNQISRKDNQPTVVSTGLFSLDPLLGQRRWTYRAEDAVILNPSLCVGDEAIFFLESSTRAAVQDPSARIQPRVLLESAELVALDKEDGFLLWRQPIHLPLAHIVYLSTHQDRLICSGCYTQDKQYWYHLEVRSGQTGRLAWDRDFSSHFSSSDTDHGKQDKHPMILGDKICFKYGSFDLYTGESLDYRFATTNCADCAASQDYLFGRNHGVPTIYPFGDREHPNGTALCSAMRPGCYISIIPAGGMILLPAYSAGCTCGYTLQTTIGWLPQ